MRVGWTTLSSSCFRLWKTSALLLPWTCVSSMPTNFFLPSLLLPVAKWLISPFSCSDKWSWWSRLRFHQRPRLVYVFFPFIFFFSALFSPSEIALIVCFLGFSSSFIWECVRVCTLWMNLQHYWMYPLRFFFLARLSLSPTHSRFRCDSCLAICLLHILRKRDVFLVFLSWSIYPDRLLYTFLYIFLRSFSPSSLSLIIVELLLCLDGVRSLLGLGTEARREKERWTWKI